MTSSATIPQVSESRFWTLVGEIEQQTPSRQNNGAFLCNRVHYSDCIKV